MIIYQLDENNYLLDDNGDYLFDKDKKQLRISLEDMEYLRRSYGVEKD